MPPKSKIDLPPLPSHLLKETFGQRLTRIRKERGLTQVELSEKTGIIQELISSYERDRLRMHAEIVLRFAMALNVTADEILGLDQKSRRKEADAPDTLDLKLVRRLKKIEQLPSARQKDLIKSLDMLLKGADH